MESIHYKTGRNTIHHWWLVLLSGVLVIGLGIWVMVLPAQSYLELSITFSFIILAGGIFEIIFSITNHSSLKWWGWTFAGGAIDLLAGIYLMLYPGITMVILPLVVGFWMLFRGVIAIGNALEIRAYGFHDWLWLLLTGILIILLAEMIFASPVISSINIVIWTGLAFVFAGVFRICFSVKLSKMKHSR